MHHSPLALSGSPAFPATLSWASILLVALTLAACGGGGSEPEPTPEPTPEPGPTPTLTAVQGIWQSAPGAATSTSAIVLPDGGLWAVQVSGTGSSATTRVLKATLNVQGSGYSATGTSYTLGGSTSAPTTVPVVASVIEKTSLSVRTGADAGTETLTLAWQARYDTSASLAGFAGAWSATLGPGTVHWGIDDQGRISGTRTTGCTYSGQLSLRPERKAVADALVQEDCAGVRTQLGGVATLNPDSGRLSMVLTTADDTQAVVLGLTR